MIKLTETREITPYRWVHQDDDDRRQAPPMPAPSEAKSDGLTRPAAARSSGRSALAP
jgi:hypothetical protein